MAPAPIQLKTQWFRHGAQRTLSAVVVELEAPVFHESTQSFPAAERAALGLSDTLIRLSPGCENTEDLVEDILEGLSGRVHESGVRETCAVHR